MTKMWVFWAISILSLLWNAGGAYDYVMTRTRDSSYLAAFPPEMLGYLDAMPNWVSAAWAIGVWGAVLGSLLLLFRSRWALWAFIASFAGMIANLVYGLTIAASPMTKMMGAGAAMFTAAIVLVAVFLVWYARRLKKAGILR